MGKIKYTKQTAEILKAYAEFAEDTSDALTAAIFPGKTDQSALSDIALAHEALRDKLTGLGYTAPERPWKRGVGRVKENQQ